MVEPASTPLTREQLYGLVWETPLRQLAPTLGYSDVGLAKACRKMKVPLPGRGHWAKKAAGGKCADLRFSLSARTTMRRRVSWHHGRS